MVRIEAKGVPLTAPSLSEVYAMIARLFYVGGSYGQTRIYIYIYILVVICVLCGLGLAYSIGSVQRNSTFSTITLDIERTLASNSAVKKADEFAGVDEFASLC